MSILVTGGAGFIGSHLVERLLHEGEEVICLDNFDTFYDPGIKRRNLAEALRFPSFTLIEGDIRDPAQVERALSGRRVGAIVHLAARAGVRPSLQDPLLYVDVNVRGSLVLLEAAARAGVERFLFASSSSVYGARETVPFREDDQADSPVSPYGATKRAAEILCTTYHHLSGTPMTLLRLFTVYGPRQRPEMAIHKFARLIDRGEEIPLYGDGETERDYTFISDIIDGICRALRKCAGCEVINLGDARPVPLTQLVALLEEGLGKKARIRRYPAQPGDVPRTYASVSKAQALLGYVPSVPLEEGIAEFLRWYRERREPAC